jgi:hypothetical protein
MFFYMETSLLLVKACKIYVYARRSGPVSREGSLSWHTCCDTNYPKWISVSMIWRRHHCRFVCLFVYYFSPCSTIFQLYMMAVSLYWCKREPTYIIQCIWEETIDLLRVNWQTFSQSRRSEQDSNRRGLEVWGLVVWDRCLHHSTTEALHHGCKISTYSRRSGPLVKEGSLSCHTCCNTNHPKYELLKV